jgi:hypothetical protein
MIMWVSPHIISPTRVINISLTKNIYLNIYSRKHRTKKLSDSYFLFQHYWYLYNAYGGTRLWQCCQNTCQRVRVWPLGTSWTCSTRIIVIYTSLVLTLSSYKIEWVVNAVQNCNKKASTWLLSHSCHGSHSNCVCRSTHIRITRMVQGNTAFL